MEQTHRVHGISFSRSGECNRCGGCNCEKLNCRHFSWDENHLAVCDVQGRKEKVCQACTKDENGVWYNGGKPVTHQMCADYPDHPWLKGIVNGNCGYTFTRIDEAGAVSFEPLPFKDMDK